MLVIRSVRGQPPPLKRVRTWLTRILPALAVSLAAGISTIGAVWSEPFLLYRICRYWLMIIIQCIVKTFCYLNIQHLFLQTIVNFIKKRQVQKFSIRSKKITKLIHNIKVSIQVIYNLIKYCVFMILASIQIFIKIGP